MDRKTIKERTAERIAIAKAAGKYRGRNVQMDRGIEAQRHNKIVLTKVRGLSTC